MVRVRVLVGVAATLAGALALPGYAMAGSTAAPPGPKALTPAQAAQPVSEATTAQAALAAENYWTPERMRTARPLDITVKPAAGVQDAPAQPPGPVGGVAGAAPTSTPSAASPVLAPPPFVTNAATWPTTYNQAQTRINGKVFFRDPSLRGNWVCSASVVNSPSKRVVWTAGHCVYNNGGMGAGIAKGYMRNWVFAPAYKNGVAPYGTWTPAQLWTLTGWVNSPPPTSFPYDTGAAVMNLRLNRRIANVVGANGLTWNQPLHRTYAFGYPATAPYNGLLFRYCNSNEFYDTTGGFGTGVHTRTVGVNCTMNGGASGGPWVAFADLRVAPGWGYVNGENSYKYGTTARIYSPYYGTAQGNLYNAVRLR